MAAILTEKIHDKRFLRLIRHMLKAGYLEDWEYHDTLSGCPQGGVVSPVLSNIYLNKLDEFVERELIPRYTRGASRARNPEYMRIRHRREKARRHGDRAAARDLLRRMRTLPSRDPMDPGYRRLRYSRYADDHILGFTGPKAEAEQIKADLTRFLRETLRLELNQDKPLTSHRRTQPARFWLQHHRPALRHPDHPRPQVGQREDRAARAAGRCGAGVARIALGLQRTRRLARNSRQVNVARPAQTGCNHPAPARRSGLARNPGPGERGSAAGGLPRPLGKTIVGRCVGVHHGGGGHAAAERGVRG